MFRDLFYRIIDSSGVEERDIEKLLRSEDYITDEQFFCISDFLNRHKSVNIFFTRNVGGIRISARLFEVAMVYEFYNKDNTRLATIDIDFAKETLFVNYQNETIEIYNSFVDFEKSKQNQLNRLRMEALSELCIRYFIKLVYAVYKELRR